MHSIVHEFMTKDNLPPQVVFAVKRLRMLREDVYRYSLESVADYLGISRSFISNVENLHSEPRISTLMLLCDYFNIELDKLFAGCPGLDGKDRIPRDLIPDASRTLWLAKDDAKAIVKAGLREHLWLAICASDGQDEETIRNFQDWIRMKAEIYR